MKMGIVDMSNVNKMNVGRCESVCFIFDRRPVRDVSSWPAAAMLCQRHLRLAVHRASADLFRRS